MEIPDFSSALNSFGFFLVCFLPLATPLGFLVALIVRRIAPMLNILVWVILAVYIVGVVILFALLRHLVADTALNQYGAAMVSMVGVAGIIFLLAYLVRRRLLTEASAMTDKAREQQTFSVFGEDIRARPKPRKRRR